MKRFLLFLLLAPLFASAQTTITGKHYEVIGWITKDGVIQNKHHETVGYVKNGVIYDKHHAVLERTLGKKNECLLCKLLL